MRLYYLRHGESETNRDDIITGQLDVALTEKGRQQAKKAGERIRSSGIIIDVMVTSPLIRAYDTGTIIAAEIGYRKDEIITTELLKERYFGELEGKPKTQLYPVDEETLQKYGAETESALGDRAAKTLEWLRSLKNAKTVLIVAHNGFGRRLKATIDNVELDDVSGFRNAELFDLGEV